MSALKRLIREPLLHFAAIGAVLFAADLATREEAEDPRLIKIDEPLQRELAELFQTTRGSLPTETEMDQMVEQHIKNEVLYREARSLQLDHGDDMIRERLAQRLRQMMYSGITVDDPTEDDLRAWFDARAERYETPATVSFRVIGVDGDEALATEVADAAAARAAGGEVVKPTDYHMLTFNKRPRPQLVDLFGEKFIAAIEASPMGEWSPVESPRGWQAVELIATTASSAPTFEQARDGVLTDWRQFELQREARTALESLMTSYPVRRVPYSAELLRRDDAPSGEPATDEAAVVQ